MKLIVGVLVVIAAFAVRMPSAEAKGLFIINTGEDVAEVAKIKPDALAEVESSTAVGAKIGMMYSRFGIFWLDIWRWDKKFVIFQGNTVWELTEDQAKELAVDGKLDVPFTMTLPPGLIVILGGLGIFIAIKVLGRKKDGDGGGDTADAASNA
jgi:hypothetical protein